MTGIAQVLLKHRVVPTGVGVVLTTENRIALTTPCCGLFFDNRGQSALNEKWSISAWCQGCGAEWTKLMFDTEAVLYFESELEYAAHDRRWLAGALGVSEYGLKVTVE